MRNLLIRNDMISRHIKYVTKSDIPGSCFFSIYFIVMLNRLYEIITPIMHDKYYHKIDEVILK